MTQALTAIYPASNPHLARGHYPLTHYDMAATDIIRDPIRRGTFTVDLAALPRVYGGPVNIVTPNAAVPGFYWGAGNDRVAYIDAREGRWEELTRLTLPYVPPLSREQIDAVVGHPFTSVEALTTVTQEAWGGFVRTLLFPNNIYPLVDADNTLYATAGILGGDPLRTGVPGTLLLRYGLKDMADPRQGIVELARLDSREVFPTGAGITGVSMTYDGKLIVVGHQHLAIVARDLKTVHASVNFGEDELVSNSVSVDERNGIYVASGSLHTPGANGTMRKIIWTGERLSLDEADGAWSAPYLGGEQPPAVKHGFGTGSTPTLMGFGAAEDRLVVITDGQNHMSLVAFWRDEIPAYAKPVPGQPSPRIAGAVGVTCGFDPLPQWLQSEQSVVVMGDGAFVINNIPNKPFTASDSYLVTSLAAGPLLPTAYGVEKFRWNAQTHAWERAWARPDVSSTSMVPAVSSVSQTVVMNGYSDTEGWIIEQLDWGTGEHAGRVVFGKQHQLGNGFYSIFEYMENGDQIFNSVGGPIRIPFSRMSPESE